MTKIFFSKISKKKSLNISLWNILETKHNDRIKIVDQLKIISKIFNIFKNIENNQSESISNIESILDFGINLFKKIEKLEKVIYNFNWF